MTEQVVYIRKREFGRVQPCDPGDHSVLPGEYWVVEGERGMDFGQVVKRPGHTSSGREGLKKLIRKLSPDDLRQIEQNEADARETFRVCQEKIQEKALEMKLVRVEYSFDRSRLLFYFTADGRIDFRELVKELAGIFKTRIELRQIGVRDEARMMGGIGPCGRELCCRSFLSEFEPINIRMAKTQRLPLDPDKISGVCGRLFCCLRYEEGFYRSCRKVFPKEGTVVKTRQGEGKIVDFNCIRGTVTVETDDGRKFSVPREELSDTE
ncbi:MAG TPA: stage 0 sporulation family protein [bacterium]|nr:stage 0 sporulation family protein [bacterium]HPQ66705.1 stage 0 sporulation family protein [bacterium]